MKKTKKIKVIIACILTVVTIVTIGLVSMSLNKVSYMMKINKPSRIVVYYNTETGNKVFEPQDEQYTKLYSLIISAHKQTILHSISSNNLGKKVKIESVDNKSFDFIGIKINFVYDSPQVVNYKSKMYTLNNQPYWYQNLIFEISNDNQFKYNTIAIIPPVDSSYYQGTYNYSLQYKTFSNLNNTYNYALKLF